MRSPPSIMPSHSDNGEVARSQTARVPLVATPSVVDQQIEPSLLVAYAPEERLYLLGLTVIAGDGDAAAAAADLISCIFDGAELVVGCRTAANAAPGDINRSPTLTQHDRDPAPHPTAGASNNGNLALQRLHRFTYANPHIT